MASPIDELRSAGFSDQEIGDWVQERTKALKEGGFPDNEIDAYFTGGPVVKDTLPTGFLGRLFKGQRLTQRPEALENFGAEIVTRKNERMQSAVENAWKEGYGNEPTDLPLEDYQKLEKMGFVGPSPIGMMNAGGFALAYKGIASTFRALNALPTVAGAMVEQEAEEITGNQGKAKGIGRDVKGLLDAIAMVLAGSAPVGATFTKPVRRPTGEVVDVPIGPVPKSGDFVTAQKAIVPEATESTAAKVQGKLNALWERGIHPAEVMEDAATDPALKAELLSKTPMLPERYRASTEFTKQDDLFGAQPEQGSFRFMNEPESLPQNVPTRYNVGDNGTYRDQKGRIRSIKTEPIERADMEWGLNVGRKGEQPIYKRMLDDNTTERTQLEMALENDYQPSFKFDSGEMNAKGPEPTATETGSGGGASKPPTSYLPDDPDASRPGFREAAAKANDLIHSIYTNVVDNLHPISRIDKDAYQAGRLYRGRFGVAKQFLENGTIDFGTLKRRGPGLNEILRPVKDHEALNAYLRDRSEASVTGDADAAARVAAGDKKFGKAAAKLDKFREEVLDYLHKAGVLTDEARSSLSLLDEHYAALAPLIDGKPLPVDPLANIIRNTYHYVGLAQKNLVNQKLFSAFEKAGIGVEHQPSLSVEMGKNMREYAKAHGLKAPPASVTNILKALLPDDGNNFSALFNGKRRTLRIDDKELITAIRNLSPYNSMFVTRLLAHPASWLRAGVTLDPAFMAKNIIRDSFTAFVTAGTHPLNTLSGFGHALSGTRGARALGIRPTETFQHWLSSGGANATLVHLDQRYMQQSLRHLENQTGLLRRTWNVVKSPLDGLRLVSELIENSVRIGAFKKAAKGETSPEALRQAAYASREATLDFARVGAKTQAYNLVTAFFNAGIQGPDRIARAFIDKPAATSLKVAAGITMPSLMLWWANKDDPRYQQLPQWQKDMFWIFLTDKWEPISAQDAQGKPPYLIRQGKDGLEFNNGTIWRKPKPFELGIVFGSLAERAAEYFYRKNPDAFAHMDDAMTAAFNLNFVPTIAAPFVDQYANTSQMTGRKVIPGYLEKELPEYQYTPYTTEVAKFVGHVMATLPGLREASVDDTGMTTGLAHAVSSPVLLENYLRSWTGGLGVLLLEATDKGLKKAGALPNDPEPTKTWADTPFAKAFAIRYPGAIQATEDFFTELARNERFLTSWKNRAKSGDAEAMQRIQDLGGDQMFMKLDSIRRAMSQHAALIRNIYKNKDIPPEQQRQLIDQLYFNMNEMGTAGRQILRDLHTLTTTPRTSVSQPTPVNPGIPLQ
jgi:hypothetical protein